MNNVQTVQLKNDTKSKVFSFVRIIFCALWIALVTALFSDAGIIVFAYPLAIVFIVVWIIVWAIRFIRNLRNSQDVQKTTTASVVFWSYEPLLMLTFLALAYTGTRKQARFHMSYAALNQYAKDVNDGKVDMNFDFYHPVRQIGLYSTTMTDQLPNKGVRFVTSGEGLFTKAGFAYFPETGPPVKDKNSYRHIDGSWWLWKQGF
jgi:Na+-transporting methylmalonyl-CoA/oxaloacetate decarboxylase gamma subunit